MRTKTNRTLRKILSIALCLALVMSYVPMVSITASAATEAAKVTDDAFITYSSGVTQYVKHNNYLYKVAYTNLKIESVDIHISNEDLRIYRTPSLYTKLLLAYRGSTAKSSNLPTSSGKSVSFYTSDTYASNEEKPVVTVTCMAVSEPVWSWNGVSSATAVFTSTDGGATMTVDAAIEISEKTAENCLETDTTTYTATATANGKEYTNVKTIYGEQGPHNFEYIESGDYMIGSCTNGCGMNCTHNWTDKNDYLCDNCGFECHHESYTDGFCTVCGFECAHENITDGICDFCGYNSAFVVIDGTLGGKTTATEDDVNTLVEQLKGYVDSGITTIIVTGSEPALYNFYGIDTSAVSAALYYLADGRSDSPYCGTIDLILPDVTEIVDDEFNNTFALNSITLPKVTKLGNLAFYAARWLQTITFGSVLTDVNETGGVMFAAVGEDVGGCDLILNCGQMDSTYIPDIENNTWTFRYENEFKSITLTHTGGEATCVAKAVCETCGEEYGDIDANAHSYSDVNSNGDGTHSFTCTACHITGIENHTGGTATCKTQAVCEVCGESYGELDKTNHDETVEYNNGFCTECDAYEPAELKDGYYQIENGGNLFWFANYINTVDRTANAVLTADIDLENRLWTPIGSTSENSNNFRGVFDGQNHTIKGLYVEGGRAGLGFFGEVRTGTVKNFTIYGEVVANTDVNYVGGVIGSICGLNGDNDLERNGAIIQNITSYVNLTAKTHGIGMIGGFVGYANHESLIENCSWYGTFDAGIYRVDSGAGGFIGKIQESTSIVTIRNCGAYGTIKTNYAKNSYNNTATIYMGGFLSFSNTGAQTAIENCLFAGKFECGENLTDEARLGAFGTLRSVNAIKNCYYLGDDGLEAVHSDSSLKPGENIEITSVTREQLKSGEVAYLLGEAWGQVSNTEGSLPIITDNELYKVVTVGETGNYSVANVGDTNGDGTVDVTDYQALVNKALADDHEQIETASYDDIIRYDLDGDGYLDVIDAYHLHLFINGFTTVDVYAVGDYDLNGKAFEEADIKAIKHAIENPEKLATYKKYASDINGDGKLDENDLTALTVKYGEVTGTECADNVKVYYRWGNKYSTCTATAMCTLCGKKVATETVNTTSETLAELTCTQDGKVKYTATFQNELLGTKSIEIVKKATGHSFNDSGECICGAKLPVVDLTSQIEGGTVIITGDCRIIGDGNEYNISLNIAEDATVIFDVGTGGVQLLDSITVADGKTLTLLVAGDAEHTVNGGISLGNGSNVIIEGDLTKANNKLTVSATDGNAGIGANGGVTAGDITIRNARVDATGSSKEVSMDQNPEIFGADTSISGAAIGTSDGSMGNILIENSIIVAEGGYYENTSHAPAIGIGYVGSTMGNITLKDSQITARNNGDGLASVIGAGANHHVFVSGSLGDIVITNTDLNLSMAIGTKNCYAAMIGSGIGFSHAYVNMGKIIFTDVTQAELDEIIPTWLPSDFNEWGAYALGRGYDGSVYKYDAFGGVWVSDGSGGTVQIGGEGGYHNPE